MPTYRNDTQKSITRNGIFWGPGEIKPAPFYAFGLTKVSDDPEVKSFVLLSKTIDVDDGKAIIDLPNAGNISLQVRVISGDPATIRLGKSPEIPIDGGSMYGTISNRDSIGAVEIVSTGSTSVAILVEELI